MDDKEKRRLNRQFAVTWFLLLLMILAVMFMVARRPEIQTHNFVGQQGAKGDSIVGPIGPVGESVKGEKGDPGKTTVIENNTTIYRTETVKGERGDTGEKGQDGKPAPVLQIQVNPESKNLEYKYDTDSLWTLLIPCDQLIKDCNGTITQ